MAKALAPYDPQDQCRVDVALRLLRDARRHLIDAKAPRAAARDALAIKSTDGALRHVHHRRARAVRETGF